MEIGTISKFYCSYDVRAWKSLGNLSKDKQTQHRSDKILRENYSWKLQK